MNAAEQEVCALMQRCLDGRIEALDGLYDALAGSCAATRCHSAATPRWAGVILARIIPRS